MGVFGDIRTIIKLDEMASQRREKNPENQPEQQQTKEKNFPVLGFPRVLECRFQSGRKTKPRICSCPFRVRRPLDGGLNHKNGVISFHGSATLEQVKRIAVYCGSNKGTRSAYAEAAEKLGSHLARRGIGLVYGGGCVGLMGILADATLKNGGHVIGVIPEKLVIKEVVHEKLPDLRVVKTMHERKALMAELADGFIALPGGYGTYEEFCEVLAWSQLGYHQKPFGLLDVAGFYRSFLEFFDHATREGFIRPQHRELVMVEEDAEKLLRRLETFQPPKEVKWIK